MTTLVFDTHVLTARVHQKELASKQDLKETELRLELKLAETKSDLIR